MLFHKVFGSVSLSIFGVSAGVTLFSLPLYIVAEKWQKIERETRKYLAPKMTKIKSVFKGDEQYMILSAYYRQNHYHPVYALRNSLGILIQIPFFIAAYIYLSHQNELKDEHFLFIKDLGGPDALLTIGAFTINILPICMTLINVASGILYTHGLDKKDKAQIYITALVFLVLLYNSPSGLVLYWTMNNVFSFIKNIFYRLKNPLRLLYILASFFTVIFIVYLLFINTGEFRKRAILSLFCAFIPFIPLFLRLVRALLSRPLLPLQKGAQARNMLFIIACISAVVLCGLYIPSAVISSSPDEFSFIDKYKTPFPFIANTFLQTVGICVLWPFIIYFLFNEKIKTLLAAFAPLLFFTAILNTFVFQGEYGMISNTFIFDSSSVLSSPSWFTVVNIAGIVLLAALFVLAVRKNIMIPLTAAGLLLASLTAASVYNGVHIYAGYTKLAAQDGVDNAAVHSLAPIFSLAKDKPNVVVIMADRAEGGFLKDVFDEHPALSKKYSGFIWYPNTVSFAAHTLMGVAPVWGGYEYTPRKMNSRDNEALVDKHNEALMVLPRILSEGGFDVTVTDQSWANYSWVPDNSIYKPYKNIQAFNTVGHYTNLWYMRNNLGEGFSASERIKRNALWFSLMKIAPPPLRFAVYDGGMYWALEDTSGSLINFINPFAVIDFLPELTVYNADNPAALLITNETTHNNSYLQYPGYRPVPRVTDKGNGRFSEHQNYHTMNAFFITFAKWLDALRENDVYDNTRIIIAADHGWHLPAEFNEETFNTGGTYEAYHPVLLVKDFNANGDMKIDMTFMTNADVPALAASGLIENAQNPFTGRPIAISEKSGGIEITTNRIVMSYQHPKNIFKIKNKEWLHVRDNIFRAENWSTVEFKE